MVDRVALEQTARNIDPVAITGQFWRQVSPPFALDQVPPKGRGGRYDREEGPPVLYLSDRRGGAWAELFRHHTGTSEVSLHLVRRRTGTVSVSQLDVLDVADPQVRAQLGIVDDDLVADGYQLCQDLSDAARAAGFDGLRAPGGAMAGPRTLVVFAHAASKVVADGAGSVTTPPLRSAGDLVDIRFKHARTFRSAVAGLPRRWRVTAALSLLFRRRR